MRKLLVLLLLGLLASVHAKTERKKTIRKGKKFNKLRVGKNYSPPVRFDPPTTALEARRRARNEWYYGKCSHKTMTCKYTFETMMGRRSNGKEWYEWQSGVDACTPSGTSVLGDNLCPEDGFTCYVGGGDNAEYVICGPRDTSSVPVVGSGESVPPAVGFDNLGTPPVVDFDALHAPPVVGFGGLDAPPMAGFDALDAPPVVGFGGLDAPPMAGFGGLDAPPIVEFDGLDAPPTVDVDVLEGLFPDGIADDAFFQGGITDALFPGGTADDAFFQGGIADDAFLQGGIADDALFQGGIADDALFQGGIADDAVFQGGIAGGGF
ncbi:uncharacterized protein UV8b_06084 [Ustilaginoidea virens]|uniref:Uncharacterized protein n=1 Tax=Ustilaginoidea virens TaxID=1159556 RepID=A0A8E5MIR5_USTVR|nr:uncharacterized protein UV8b_06084 [Ustilaginoidea virens]QUC21843.1 hypothetical protein UV8b_06084 [Ustilaginoidea virens]